MAAKDDASTDVEALAAKLATTMTTKAKAIQDDRTKAGAKKDAKGGAKAAPKGGAKKEVIPTVKFVMSKNPVTKSRTPAEQAKLVVSGASSVCWSAHLADSARDITMVTTPKMNRLEEIFGDRFDDFKTSWMDARKSLGLKDAAGKDGWVSWDPFHVEMPDSKVDKNDVRAQACIEEYVRLTREDGKKKNQKFETKYSDLIEKFEPKGPNPKR